MIIKLVRRYAKPTYIIGEMYVNGQWFCNTLEPSLERRNFPGIPFGTYQVTLAESAKFRDLRPFLLNVPKRTGIMIHEGNSVADTLGCILLGINRMKGRVLDSKKHVYELIRIIKKALRDGERVDIVIS